MSWSQQVFNYCERGLDPGFWAEPLNAVSNAAFILAAGAAGARLARLAPEHRSSAAERVALWLLVALVGAIGVGSFLFHTFATRWALIADVAPITLFMVAYLAYALRTFLGVGWVAIALILPAFVYAGSLAGGLSCGSSTAAGGGPQPCLNGSLGYAPALVSLLIIGWLARRRGEAAGTTLIAAGAVFLVSATLRTIDRDVCAATELLGHVRGTHALWHTLNAVTLYLLLSAAIGRVERSP